LNIKNAILWSVVTAWLVGAGYAMWFFELRFERPFVSPAHATLFESGSEAPAAEDWFRHRVVGTTTQPLAPDATVVHVYDASCPCNRFTEPHLAKIEATYQRRHVRFVRIERSSPQGAGSPQWIEASPAALVFDSRGRLVYFGPYSESASCGTSNGLVERVLDQVLSGRSPAPQLVISGGCFCAHTPRKVLGINL
jgi:hypothetical protein